MSALEVVVREVETPRGPGRAHVCRPAGARGTVVLGHGAGGGLGSLDLAVARAVFASAGWAVALVEQPWLVAGKRVASPPPTLDEAWRPIVTALVTGRGALPRPLVVGGRSAGARVACRTADELSADGALLLSFPLHPPGRPEKSRAPELALAPRRTVLVHGTKDPFGTPEEVAAVLPEGAVLLPVPGTHSYPATSRDALVAALHEAESLLRG